MKVNIRNIVNKFKMPISIMQTMYEAITNSLEANAENIEIILTNNETTDGSQAYSNFTIIDDGDGFNEDNLKSFLEYLSAYKYELGCKGLGRFTWLKVFGNVSIVSKINNAIVSINFSKDFNEDDSAHLKKVEAENQGKETKITFNDCLLKQAKYINKSLNEIKELILDHFAIKFYLLKNQNKKVNIIIKDTDSNVVEKITFNDIFDLQEERFNISTKNNNYSFVMYYNFFNNEKNKRKVVLCANERAIHELNILSELPNKNSLICLIMGQYLDDCVDDSRTEFVFNKNRDGLIGLSLKEVEEGIKNKLEQIIIGKFPEISEENIKIEEECVDEYPHLKKYIVSDEAIIKNKKNIIKKAKELYEDEKEKTKNDFVKLLTARKIDETELLNNIYKLNDISNKELAQYIIYRQQIIDCLGKFNENHEKIEGLLHDLFIPRGTVLNNNFQDQLDNNIWLLDDKFMSCTNLFSDKKVKTIKELIKKEDIEDGMDDAVEPDLTIFYENNTAVVVEFKALGANYNKKIDAISEISRNHGIVASNIENVNVIYGYIITQFDEKFLSRMRYQPAVKQMKLYSNGDEQMFYIYNENIINKEGINIPCHTYIISTDSIYKDANARNKLFIEILKNKDVAN